MILRCTCVGGPDEQGHLTTRKRLREKVGEVFRTYVRSGGERGETGGKEWFWIGGEWSLVGIRGGNKKGEEKTSAAADKKTGAFSSAGVSRIKLRGGTVGKPI